jgi:hypothetical protein
MAVESASPAVVHSCAVESSSAAAMQRPPSIGAFQFVILASLRAIQLTRGCSPRIDGAHKNTVIAQLEVSQGKVVQSAVPSYPVPHTFVEV